jgi:energy-coupling factor transporter transmembrane protein EcfT
MSFKEFGKYCMILIQVLLVTYLTLLAVNMFILPEVAKIVLQVKPVDVITILYFVIQIGICAMLIALLTITIKTFLSLKKRKEPPVKS